MTDFPAQENTQSGGALGDELAADVPTNAGKRPNILMIFSDQHQARMSGFMGASAVRTPNLDKLAAGGAVFENAYCNAPLCSPSRQSFMSGLHCYKIGCWNNTVAMPADTVTWAHMLSLAGYETSLLGKMHFNGYQKMYGFDRRPVLEGTDDGGECHSWGIRTTHSWTAPFPYTKNFPERGVWWDELMAAGADTPQRLLFQHEKRVLKGTLDLLKEKTQDPGGKPWAICAGFELPHPPYKARPDLLERVRGRGDLPVNWRGVGQDTCDRHVQRYFGDLMNLPQERIRFVREVYFALVEEFDEYAGQILDYLDASGLAENTVVFYFSDHGEMAGEHAMWGKVTLHESSVRVPLCLRWPGRVKPGSRVPELVSLVDLFPTFLDIARTRTPEELELDGRSLLPLLDAAAPHGDFENRSIFCEFEGQGWNHPRAMLRRGPFKLVHNHTAETRLYRLDTDAAEMADLSADPAYAKTQAALRDELFAFWDPAKIERQVIGAQVRGRIARCRNVCGDLGW